MQRESTASIKVGRRGFCQETKTLVTFFLLFLLLQTLFPLIPYYNPAYTQPNKPLTAGFKKVSTRDIRAPQGWTRASRGELDLIFPQQQHTTTASALGVEEVWLCPTQ